MKKQLLVTAVATIISAGAYAQDYDFELRGGMNNTDIDLPGADSIETYHLGGSYYFNTVSTENVPWGEAAFLNRASNIFGDISYSENTGNDVSSGKLGVEVFIPNTDIYAELNYLTVDSNGDDDDRWQGSIGYLPVDGLLLTTTFTENVDYDPNVAAKYVMLLEGGTALNLHGGFTLMDDTTAYNAGVDYYFTEATSLGFEYSDLTDTFGQDVATKTLRGKHFFDDSFYLSAFYTDTKYVDTYGVELGLRF